MDTKPLTILVVDDTEAQRYAVAHALRRSGFRVIEAGCGEQALELAKQRPDLILLDVKLPDIDGYQVCRDLKANAATADIPIIQFSAHFVDAEYRIEGLKHGADDYIANPASTEELVVKMNVWARVRRAEADLKRRNEELAAATADLELRLRANEEAQAEQERIQATLDSARREALFFANALQQSSQAFAAGSTDGRLSHFNDAFVRLTGYSAEELKSATWSDDLTPPEWRQPERRVLEELHRTRQPQVYEKEYLRKDGTRVPLEIRVHLGTGADGSDYYYAFVTDITERKRAQDAVRSERDFSSAILQTASALIVVLDREARIVQFNRACEVLTGLSATEAHGRFVSDFIPSEEMAGIVEQLNALAAGDFPNTHENHWITRDGRRRLIEWTNTCLTGTDGQIEYFIATGIDITDRKHAEEAVRAAEERFRLVLENMSEGLMLFDANGNLIYQNVASLRIHGFDGRKPDDPLNREEVKATWEAWDEQGRPINFGEWPVSRVFRNECFQRQVLRVRRVETGQEFYGSYNGSPLYDAAGNLVAGFITIRDITEEVTAAKALRESEQRFRDLADNMSQFAWMADEKGSLFWYNRRWYEYTGTTLEEVQGWGWQKVHHPDHLNRVVEKISHCFQTGDLWEDTFPLRGKDGKYRWFLSRAVPIRDDQGKVARWFGTNTDITEQRQAEEALRESEARFRATVENVPQMVWAADAQAHFRYLSPKWTEYTGTAAEQNFGSGWADLVHPEDRAQAVDRWQAAVQNRSTYEAEYRLRRWDGEYRWHSSRAVPMTEAKNGEPLWFGTTTDIHDQKRTQELLIRSEKVAALGRMAASLAHDINNPLAAAMNTLFLARNSVGSDEELNKYLETADEELKRISHITRQALGFYREHSKPALVSLSATMDEAIAVCNSRLKSRHVCLTREYRDDGSLLAIGGELRQVFCNLVSNSADAIGDHGLIKLRVSSASHPKTGHPCVRVTVADNGAGIDRDHTSQLFEPLFSTKGSFGTGLGLWVSRQLVEKHGGSIRVRSATKGRYRGTTFSILLPASTAQDRGSSEPSSGAAD